MLEKVSNLLGKLDKSKVDIILKIFPIYIRGPPPPPTSYGHTTHTAYLFACFVSDPHSLWVLKTPQTIYVLNFSVKKINHYTIWTSYM